MSGPRSFADLPASSDIHFDPSKAGYSLNKEGWVQLGNVNNSELFGSKANPPLFKNLYFKDSTDIRKLCSVERLNLEAIRGITKNEHAILYVILEDGNLILVHETGYVQTPYGPGRQASIKHGEVAQLTQVFEQSANPKKLNWRLAAAAGEVWVQDGKIFKITNASGGFLPQGTHIKNLVEHVFVRNGFSEARGAFSYETPNWFFANTPIIHNSQLLRASHLSSNIFIPQEFTRPVTFTEFEELRYSQQSNVFKRMFNIPVASSQVVVNNEIAAELARKEFWQMRTITVSASHHANRGALQAVGNFCRPIVPYTPHIATAAAYGVELYREYKANPEGRYFHDSMQKFVIDTICFYPVFAIFGAYTIPIILTANMPDLTNAHEEACKRSFEFNPRTAGELLWQSELDERAYELGFANGMRKLARGILVPSSYAAAEMKQTLVDEGTIAGVKSPFCKRAMAEFKANLDAQAQNGYQYEELNFKAYLPLDLIGTKDLSKISWNDLGPKPLQLEAIIPAMPKQIIYPAPTKPFHYNPVPGSCNNSQFKFDPNVSGVNVDYNLGAAIGTSVVSIGMGAPIVAVAAVIYFFAENSFYKKGRKYYASVKDQSIKSSNKMTAFNTKLNEVKTQAAPTNAAEMSERANQWRGLIHLLDKTQEAYKDLSDLTNVDYRHKTRSNFWGWHTLTDSEYDLVKKIHNDSDKTVGDKKERTGLYEKHDTIWRHIHALEAAIPKQSILDSVKVKTEQQKQAFLSDMQPVLADCASGKISDSELLNVLANYINKNTQIKNTDFATAQDNLKNEAAYLEAVKANSSVVADQSAKAAGLVAATLYNKHFCSVNKDGLLVIEPDKALNMLEALKPYQAYSAVTNVTEKMKTTLNEAFTNRVNFLISEMTEHKRPLLACLADVKALQAEMKVLVTNKDIIAAVTQPFENMLAIAKSATLDSYQALVNDNKLSEADILLAGSLLSAEEQLKLKTATARFQAEIRQQKIQLTFDIANQSLRAGYYALNIFGEMQRSQHRVSAPSIPTANLQRANQFLWQAPAARDQHGSDPLRPPSQDPITVIKNVKI